MSIPVLNNLDLNLNQLLNALFQQLGTDPVSPTEGQVWYNTASHEVRYYNGSATVILYRAVSTATASTVVLRDASGDFAAHDVTVNKVTISGTPSAATDAATVGYVGSIASGLDVKASVRVATTANVTLSGAQTIDGVSAIAGDRVLVKDQSTGSENGLWVVASGAWSRAADADTSAEVTAGLYTFVAEGTVNADSGWILTTNDPITLGTTALVFAQFSGAGQITAGAGLTKTGNTLDVVGTADRITVNANDIDIASTYAGQTSITTLGTIATGTWSGTAIAIAKGGTGQATAAAGFDALSPMTAVGDLIYGGASGTRTRLPGNTAATKKFLNQTGNGSASAAPSWDALALADLPSGTAKTYATDIGDGSATSYTVTHNLGTRDVVVLVRDNNSPYAQVFVDVEATSTTAVTIKFAVAPASNRYRAVVHA